ncbi:MAG: hypothetical protein JSV32_04500, partial [Dehalococcoidia bacterium]
MPLSTSPHPPTQAIFDYVVNLLPDIGVVNRLGAYEFQIRVKKGQSLNPTHTMVRIKAFGFG